MIALGPQAPVALAVEHLAKGHVLRARTAGNSMWPTLRDGQLIEIFPCHGDDVLLGNIVLVETSKGLVLHRVIRTEPDRLLLKGDALRRTDGYFLRQAVLGRIETGPMARWHARLAGPLGIILSFSARLRRAFFDRTIDRL